MRAQRRRKKGRPQRHGGSDSRVGVDVGGRLLCYLYLVMLLGVLTGLGVILIVRYGVS